MLKRKILFLSALDFKDKSIQVIIKTPLAYANKGWDVDYLVARDNCPKGNYFYESEINPASLNVVRTYWPFPRLRAKLPRVLYLIVNKLASIIVIFKLARLAQKLIKQGRHYDVIYGYELQGVLAMNLLRVYRVLKKVKTISRFQGTFLNEMYESNAYGRLLFNLDLITAIKAKSNLLIMTDDGTQGDKAIMKIRKSFKDCVFWVNGVDTINTDDSERIALLDRYELHNKHILLSVSRLVNWKRVDRCIRIAHLIRKKSNLDFRYLIIGDGECRGALEKLVEEFELQENVIFIGAVENHLVKNYLSIADFFISMYDSSNVGNPLLEAIRAHKLIVTLNNGDTSSWIRHNETGLIYNIDDELYDKASSDIITLCQNRNVYQKMIDGIREVESERLYTWEERFDLELKYVEGLLN